MKTIEIKGKTYKKAGDLARELGYTTDYMGQLCREDKVVAELVGRTWYVEPDSVHEHKSTRYRSTKSADSKQVRQFIANKSEKHSFASESVHIHPVSYEEDEMDLIPMQKTHKTVRQSINITKHESHKGQIRTHFSTATTHLKAEKDIPEPAKSKGTLSVVRIEDVVTDIEPVDFVSVVSESTRLVIPNTPKRPHFQNRAQPHITKEETPAFVQVEKTYTLKYTILSTLSALILAAVVSFAFISLETTTEVTSAGTSSSVRLNIEKTANVLFSSLK